MGRVVATSQAGTWHFPNIEDCPLCKNGRLIILIKCDENIHAVILADDPENVLTENETGTAGFIQICCKLCSDNRIQTQPYADYYWSIVLLQPQPSPTHLEKCTKRLGSHSVMPRASPGTYQANILARCL